MSETPVRALFAPIEPFHHGYLPEWDGHQIYFEQCGRADGVPMLFLHGGPGSGCSAKHRQLFNPHQSHVVLFDQRGCGRSTAIDPLMNNHTQGLIEDIERLRLHLKISKWWVVGGSWGAGLALAYASAHAHACMGLILRGVFLSRPTDLQWFFQEARSVMPDAWAALSAAIPPAQHHAIGDYLYTQIQQADQASALTWAQAWQTWENALTQRQFMASSTATLNHDDARVLLNKYRLQSHYLKHHCFFPKEGLLSTLAPLKTMPVHLLHGRLDWICRPESAWAVYQALPHSQLQWIDQAGHNMFEPPMTHALINTIETATQPSL